MLITLVVGLASGWWVDRREDRRWKKRATVFEHVLVDDGWKFDWHPSEGTVIITRPGNTVEQNHGYDLEREMCDCGPSVSF